MTSKFINCVIKKIILLTKQNHNFFFHKLNHIIILEKITTLHSNFFLYLSYNFIPTGSDNKFSELFRKNFKNI